MVTFFVAMPNGWAMERYFDGRKEFPNYFLSAPYRGLPKAQIPAEEIKKSRERLNAALASIFKRLEVPVFQDGRYVPVRYFDYLHAHLRQVDPSAQVVPSGGVVRAAIGYLYAAIYRAIEADPRLQPEDVLAGIAAATDGLPAHEIRGVGSDFDTLLYRFNPRDLRELVKVATSLTNSAETAAGMTSSKHAGKRAFFTIADFKVYSEQQDRSTRQGGSDVDFLAFDIQRGEMILPPAIEGAPDYSVIWDNLIAGFYRYLPPIDVIEDKAKQTVRGFRPLLELPFIQVEDDTQLRSEIRSTTLTAKAVEQFSKMVRNARFGGAHNRIYRSAGGTLENDIANLVLSYSRARRENPLVPEFVDELPLGRASDVPAELLMPIDEFIAQHTDHGVLYHGVPEIESGLAIMRQGIFISGGEFEQGTAAKGRGGYTSPRMSLARVYAGQGGMVFRLPVKNDGRLRVLNWSAVAGNPWIENLRRHNPGRDLFEVLAREHGIDIIVNDHVLVQNTSALNMVTDLNTILQSLADTFTGSNYRLPLALDRDLKTIREFAGIAAYQSALGGGRVQWPDLSALASALKDRILAGKSRLPEDDISMYETLRSESGQNLPELPRAQLLALTKGLIESGADPLRAISYFNGMPFPELANSAAIAAARLYAKGDVKHSAVSVTNTLEIALAMGADKDSVLQAFRLGIAASGKSEIGLIALSVTRAKFYPLPDALFEETELRRYAMGKLDELAAQAKMGYSRMRLPVTLRNTIRNIDGRLRKVFEELAELESRTGEWGRLVVETLIENDPEWTYAAFHDFENDADEQARLLDYFDDEHLPANYRQAIALMFVQKVKVWPEAIHRALPEVLLLARKDRGHAEPAAWERRILIDVFVQNRATDEDRKAFAGLFVTAMTKNLESFKAEWDLVMGSKGRFDIWAQLTSAQLLAIIHGAKIKGEAFTALYEQAVLEAVKRNVNGINYWSVGQVLRDGRLESLLWKLDPKNPAFWQLAKSVLDAIVPSPIEARLMRILETTPEAPEWATWNVIGNLIHKKTPGIFDFLGRKRELPQEIEYRVNLVAEGRDWQKALAGKTNLNTALVMQIAERSLNGDIAARRVLFAQSTWSEEVIVMLLKKFEAMPYEDRVLVLRKIAPRKRWGRELTEQMRLISAGANRDLILWGLSLHQRFDDCNVLLTGGSL